MSVKVFRKAVNNVQKEILNMRVKSIISQCSWAIVPNWPYPNLWGEIFLK